MSSDSRLEEICLGWSHRRGQEQLVFLKVVVGFKIVVVLCFSGGGGDGVLGFCYLPLLCGRSRVGCHFLLN